MLQALRDRVMGVLGWFVIGLIIITFALFGLGSYLQDQGQVYAAKVNDVEISTRELQMAYQNQRARMEQMLGDAYKPGLIDDQLIKQEALKNLIDQELLLQAARADGMTISDALLAARIHAIPAFQRDGRFDQERYQSLLAQQGMVPAGFEQDTRRLLIVDQLVAGVSDSAFVTDAEINLAYSLQNQKRSFEYLVVAAESFKAKIEPSAADIEAYYTEHSNLFITPRRVRLSYVRLNAAALGKTIEISEAEIKQAYEQRKELLKTQEQRRASHILFEVAADADAATVDKTRAQAESVLKQIREGGDFAELARQYSADPGSAAKGGDLGYFSPGVMVPEFDKALSALQVGQVSDLVRTQFGFHIIELTDIKASKVPTLEEARAELVAQIKQRQIEDQYYDLLETLTDVAYENPDNLQAAADATGLEVKTSQWISDGVTSETGIGEYPAVRTAAFSDDVFETGNNSEPLEVGQNDAIVVRVKDREAAHPTPIAEVKDRIISALKQERATDAARAEGEQLLQKIADGAVLKDLADTEKLLYRKADAVERDVEEQNSEVVRRVFGLPRPGADKPIDKGFALINGDYAVVQLTSVVDADPASMTAPEREQMKRGFINLRRNQVITSLADDLRRKATVTIPEERE